MIGYKPVFFIKWCWMILTPGICAVSPLQTQKQEQQHHQQQQITYHVDVHKNDEGQTQQYLNSTNNFVCLCWLKSRNLSCR